MTIKTQVEPAGGRDIVHSALSQRSHRAKHFPSLSGTPQTGAPLPVYLLSRDEASLQNPLANAKLIGWKYPILGGDSVGLASLLITEDGLKFAGINHGLLSGRLLDAAVLADSKQGPLAKEFEPRLLEIPSLRIYALWLFCTGSENSFISLMDGHPPGSAKLRIVKSIRSRIRTALIASKSQN